MTSAFQADAPASPMRPDAGKQRLLAVSLLYTENVDGELPEPLLTVRQVAAVLGLSPATVYALCARGALRHSRVAWAIRIARGDLETFVAGRSVPETRTRALPAHQTAASSASGEDVEQASDPERLDAESADALLPRNGALEDES